MFRTRQHQVELELLPGGFCHLLTQRAARRQRIEGTELSLQMVRSRIPQQR